jgi:hypothetical protein
MEPVDKKYNFLQPIKTPNLIRFGGKLDGGYVVDFEIINKCNNLITFGLGPNWSFELDYLRMNNKNKVHIYDHTTSSYPYIKAIGKYFRRLITFRTTFEGFTTRVKSFYNYKKFLYSKNINFFREKITYPIKNKKDADIEKVFSRINIQEDVILKSDIEGSEYEIIDQILKYSNRINMLIFEFHWINKVDRTKYIGQFKDGKFDGLGTYTYSDGTKYIGEFKNDLPNGQGTYIYSDGTKYTGQLKDGKGIDKLEINIPSFKEEIFFNSVKKLKEHFEIIHIHGNNYFPKSEIGLPIVLEMTLLNNKYKTKKVEYVNNFPIRGLDYPNNPFQEDLFFFSKLIN